MSLTLAWKIILRIVNSWEPVYLSNMYNTRSLSRSAALLLGPCTLSLLHPICLILWASWSQSWQSPIPADNVNIGQWEKIIQSRDICWTNQERPCTSSAGIISEGPATTSAGLWPAGRPATSAGFRQAGGDIRGGFDRQTDRQTDRVNWQMLKVEKNPRNGVHYSSIIPLRKIAVENFHYNF